jgi:cephalosporin hydroxylase
MEIPWYGPPQAAQHYGESVSRVVNEYHALSYMQMGWKHTKWMGVTTYKVPNDLWMYQEIIHELKPDLIVETGTFQGGSALYMACLLDTIGKGEIITIDINRPDNPPEHPRLSYILGSSVADETVAEVQAKADGAECVLIILDSSHLTAHVSKEMRIYSEIVTKGSYLIVEDSNVNGHPIIPEYRESPDDEPGGPMEAIEAFLAERDDFEIDIDRHRYLMTFNPCGYLRKKA